MDGVEMVGTQQQQKLLELVYENTRNPSSFSVGLHGEHVVLKDPDAAVCVCARGFHPTTQLITF